MLLYTTNPFEQSLAASRMVELSRMAALVTLLWTTHANLKLGMASIIITWVAAVGFFVFLRHFVSPVIGDCTHRMIHILRLLQKLLTIRIQRGSTTSTSA